MTPTADPADSVVLFADLQPALVANSATNGPGGIEAAAVALARGATIVGMPLLFSVVPEGGAPASHLPGLAPYAGPSNTFTRRCASPLQHLPLLAALEATHRRTIIIAAYSAEAVVQFIALDAIDTGYRPVVVLDACGARTHRTESAALRRIERTGAVVTSVADVLMTAAPDFASSPGRELFAIVHHFMAGPTA